MKLASFFILSLSLHASVLVYPVSFLAPIETDLIDVTILPQEELGGAGGYGDGKIPSQPKNHKPHGPTPSLDAPRIEAKTLANPKPQNPPAETTAKAGESSAVTVAMITTAVETEGISGTSASKITDSAGGLGGTGNGTVIGSSGTGFGQGSGNGAGSADSFGAGNALTQARYRDTPKPVYPESARRQGREGRVLLRVLIDDQGKTKSVEINRSSGSDVLDHAATEAIKLWRFYPARAGDKPVESWVGIPIDFRLTDSRN
jgi:TonB family protein